MMRIATWIRAAARHESRPVPVAFPEASMAPRDPDARGLPVEAPVRPGAGLDLPGEAPHLPGPGRRTIGEVLADARQRIQRVKPDELPAALAAGALLVDTRSIDQRRSAGTIPGSVHVPLSVLPWRLDPAAEAPDPALAAPARQVILVCDDGYSSSLAAATLREIGYERAGDLVGGFNGWRAAGFPVEPVEP